MKCPQFILQPLRRVEQESRAFLASNAGRRVDRKVIVILVVAALCLTVQRYVAQVDTLAAQGRWLHRLGWDRAGDFLIDLGREAPETRAGQLVWWACVTLLVNVAVPMLLIRLVFREQLRDYGLKLRGAFADYWVYFAFLAVAAPLVFLASAGERFQEKYPYYDVTFDGGLSSAFWRWEVLYAVQFFGVEFFYRGFLLHGLKLRFGAYAILVMMVPYCMLHFTKPLPETLAAIVGAIVLGFMSLRTRSIWMGTAIHITVAGLMDLTSLWRKGLLF